jgi:hypothetical protein
VLGWKLYHGRWPNRLHEWLAIFFHDLGYVGCSDMDGPSGISHPERSVKCLQWFWPECIRWTGWFFVVASGLINGHSRSFAAKRGLPTSSLCAPDKLSVLFDPEWFYLLRARLSGEIWEYIRNSPTPDATPREWLRAYKAEVRARILKLETL